MSAQYPAFLVLAPLITALVIAIIARTRPAACHLLAAIALAVSLWSAAGMLARVLGEGPFGYHLGNWPPPIGIAFQVDHLNALVLVVMAAVALINLITTRQAAASDFAQREGYFYALYLLFCAGTFGILVTGDAFNLYVLLEITSISGYALVGLGNRDAALASLNYVFLGTIGASLYLLGVGYLYLVTGSLNMADIATILPRLYASKVVMAAFVIAMTGLFMKMALFPLHGWLPNAYSEAASPVRSLIAPLTTKTMIYVMIRLGLYVFPADYTFAYLAFSPAVVWLAAASIVAASVMALSQTNLRRMLAYVLIAEVGYMVGGFWLGNRTAITGAILHIVNDTAMTLCVFLAVGSLRQQLRDDRFTTLKGGFRRMPWTMAVLVTAGLSMIGVPPTCGFFSKWYLIGGALAADHWGLVSALVFSSLVNAVLFFRVFEIAYFEPFADPHQGHQQALSYAEAPVAVLAPMLLTAAGLVVLGLLTGQIVTHIIDAAIPAAIL
ncbi:MAG: proton-conducting transporter membrane subunit [Desulfobacteraceae bacterium]|jgi:multicomponent Na+:H+ antiporter subunit D|nr:proton-conducting transporter membrane subunit [Desulfobacteraceae bacterium]